MFTAMKQAEYLREGGNLWGPKQGPTLAGDPFAKFRASPWFAGGQQFFPPGWTTLDRVADPEVCEPARRSAPPAGSPAIDAGQPVPPAWPDPLRGADQGQPDMGALPLGVTPWGVGVDGRIPFFGERQ